MKIDYKHENNNKYVKDIEEKIGYNFLDNKYISLIFLSKEHILDILEKNMHKKTKKCKKCKLDESKLEYVRELKEYEFINGYKEHLEWLGKRIISSYIAKKIYDHNLFLSQIEFKEEQYNSNENKARIINELGLEKHIKKNSKNEDKAKILNRLIASIYLDQKYNSKLCFKYNIAFIKSYDTDKSVNDIENYIETKLKTYIFKEYKEREDKFYKRDKRDKIDKNNFSGEYENDKTFKFDNNVKFDKEDYILKVNDSVKRNKLELRLNRIELNENKISLNNNGKKRKMNCKKYAYELELIVPKCNDKENRKWLKNKTGIENDLRGNKNISEFGKEKGNEFCNEFGKEYVEKEYNSEFGIDNSFNNHYNQFEDEFGFNKCSSFKNIWNKENKIWDSEIDVICTDKRNKWNKFIKNDKHDIIRVKSNIYDSENKQNLDRAKEEVYKLMYDKLVEFKIY